MIRLALILVKTARTLVSIDVSITVDDINEVLKEPGNSKIVSVGSNYRTASKPILKGSPTKP